MMGFDAEFVVAASQILDERMAADHNRGGPVAPQAAHRAEPGFQSAVIAFDPVVRILGRVVQPARPRGLDDQRGGAMHPPVNRDVIDVDAAFREQFFNVSVRESVTEAPTDGQQDHVGREPVAGERRGSRTAAAVHQGTLRLPPDRSTQQRLPKWVAGNRRTLIVGEFALGVLTLLVWTRPTGLVVPLVLLATALGWARQACLPRSADVPRRPTPTRQKP